MVNISPEMGTFVLLVLSMIFAPSSLAATTRITWNYGVMLDAGSTSSKLKVYKWPQRQTVLQVLDVSLILNQRYKPGISDFVGNFNGIPNYLQQMIEKAKSTVPLELHSSSNLFVLATAGLRVLPEQDAINLMTSVKDYLNTSVNPFKFDPARVRILSGEEEGAYAWISANYLKNFFGSNKPPSQAAGVLEMGGGSTQITFIPDGPLLANMFPVRMGGHVYKLYTHSYLYYGQNYMSYRINKYISEETPSGADLINPCILNGDNTTYKEGAVVKTVHGGSNPSKCLEIITKFLRTASADSCFPKPCAIGQVYQPSIGSDVFYAISAYVYAPQTLKSIDELGRLDISNLNSSAFTYCMKNITEVVVGMDIPRDFASGYCMMGLYIPVLLTTSYDFPVDTKTIYIAKHINNRSVDWAMGALLYEVEQIDYLSWLRGCYHGPVSSSERSLQNISFCFIFVSISLVVKYFVWL